MNPAYHNFQLSPSRTVVTSFNPKTTTTTASITSSSSQLLSTSSTIEEEYYDEGDWVLCVSAQEAGGTPCIACALSNGELQLYDRNTLHIVQTYHQRDSLATEITFETFDANLLAVTSTDGALSLFDIRQRMTPAYELKALRPGEEALSVAMGFDGNIAAVGSSRGKIHFFDIREKRGLLGTYSQAHTNEVTKVRFQSLHGNGTTTRSTSSWLVSGSEDGLACVFDTSQPTEESALKNILSVQSPIRDVGFFGPESEGIFCLTGCESLRLYHKDRTICCKDYGTDMRQYLSNQILAGRPAGMSVLPIEYLVDCHWDPKRKELVLLGGSATGDAGVFLVGEHDIRALHYLHGGHRGVIRSSWHSNTGTSFLTVGEDARMCEWGSIASDTTMHGGTGQSIAKDGIVPIIVHRKRSGGPFIERTGGGKLRRPRSRMTASPY